MIDTLEARFRHETIHHLETFLSRIQTATALLDADQLWWRPGPGTNSVANLLLHLEGNLKQWVISGLGGAPDMRERGLEFSARNGAQRDELVSRLSEVVRRCTDTIRNLEEAEFARIRRIQGYDVTALTALYTAVEHMSYHTGQIVYVAKQLLGDQSTIDFYPQHRDE